MGKLTLNNGESGLTIRGKMNGNFTELYDALAALTPQFPAWTYTAGSIGEGLFTTSASNIAGTSVIRLRDDVLGRWNYRPWSDLPTEVTLIVVSPSGLANSFKVTVLRAAESGGSDIELVVTPSQSATGDWEEGKYTFNFWPVAQAAPARRIVSVAYAATVTPDADTTDLLVIGALTGNLTLGTPSGTPSDGQKIEIELLQDGTGGYTLTLGSGFIIPTSSSLASPINVAEFIAADSLTTMLIEWSATRSKWKLVSFVDGY